MKMIEVYPSTPYKHGALGSFGDAAYMLIRQNDFPKSYREDEQLITADHDRCISWDYDHFKGCCKRYVGSGELAIGDWARRAPPDEIMAFLIDVLKADSGVKWTGFRIMGSVNKSNGYPVWTLELFSKKEGSDTKVFNSEPESFSPYNACLSK